MEMPKNFWAVVALLAPIVGFLAVRLHWFGPNPKTFFLLGMLGTLAAIGVGYGIAEGRRIARQNRDARAHLHDKSLQILATTPDF